MAEDTSTTEAGTDTRPNIKPDQGTNPPKDTGRYAAFNTVLGQYVGGVHDSEAKARKAAKDRGVTTITVVEV